MTLKWQAKKLFLSRLVCLHVTNSNMLLLPTLTSHYQVTIIMMISCDCCIPLLLLPIKYISCYLSELVFIFFREDSRQYYLNDHHMLTRFLLCCLETHSVEWFYTIEYYAYSDFVRNEFWILCYCIIAEASYEQLIRFSEKQKFMKKNYDTRWSNKNIVKSKGR